MAEISYFQKYSQKENHITNNTLLMLRHVYRISTLKFESLLQNISDDNKMEVGLVFKQQTKALSSIPDAVISQNSFSIFIEAKAEGLLYFEQIERHISSVVDKNLPKGTAILLGLSKDILSEQDRQKFIAACKESGIKFIAITYIEIIHILRNLCSEYELELTEIINDYEEFLEHSNMLPNPLRMAIFPCGTSWKENIKYDIYYEEASKKIANAQYIGIYTKKEITHFGKIKGTVCCKIVDNKLIVENNKPETGTVAELEYDKIAEIISQTTYYTLAENFERYYVIEKLYEINIKKESPNGVMGRRYLNLDNLAKDISHHHTTSEIAKVIKNKTFE